jgi:predicted AlkP superfamily pyrophosphatase or phosphodiesterase
MSFRPAALLGLILSALLVASCQTMQPVRTAERPIVVLVSIDGFRPDYLARGETPILSRLAAEGASGSMQPSFPSKTFPNHYTIVTGLRPDHHGIVNNNMVDPEIPGVTFSLGNAAAVTDRRWWDDGEPIWVTAENAGLTTAAMFWPGSEAAIRGVRPTYFARFDQSMAGDARVDQLLAWLDLPKGERPDFATLYFDAVDTAGHHGGPGSDEVNVALKSVDASMARLVAGLEARGLRDKVVLIIVSDHGMAPTSPERVARLGPLASSRDTASVLYTGPIASVEPVAGHEAEVAAEVLAPHDHMQCWRKQDIPARFEFGTHRRVPSLFCLAEDGWEILRADQTFRGEGGGDHGYDNQAPDMQALFIANGPGVRRGAKITGLMNVDIHGLLGRLLGITVPADDGRPSDTVGVLAH